MQALTDVLHPYSDMPFAFFGHSMGALLSFELARELRRQHGIVPVHLFATGKQAPQVPDRDPPIHQLPDPAFLDELRLLNGTPEEVLQHPELMELMLPVLRADMAVSETYVYKREDRLDCSISALGGLQDRQVNYDGLVAWREQTNRSFTLRMFPGNHFFLKHSQSLVLEAISQSLTQYLE